MSLNPAAPLAPVRIPVLGHLARALGQDINLAFYLVTIFVTAVVLAVMTWGLPALVISGELDQLVTPQETREIAELIPGSEVATFKGFGHPLAAIPLDRVAWLVGEWLKLLERRSGAG